MYSNIGLSFCETVPLNSFLNECCFKGCSMGSKVQRNKKQLPGLKLAVLHTSLTFSMKSRCGNGLAGGSATHGLESKEVAFLEYRPGTPVGFSEIYR